jgi:hypothetical protein
MSAVPSTRARGVVARGHEQGEEVVELLVGQVVAVDHRREEIADHVVRRVLAAAPGLLFRIREEVDAGGAAERHEAELVRVDEIDRVRGEVGVGIAEQGVAPLDQPRPVLVRNPEQAAEHAHRKLLGDGLHEVERVGASVSHLVDDEPRQHADRVLVGVHLAAAEGLAHQAPVPGVLGRVHLHHGPPGRHLVVRHLLEPDAARDGEALVVPAHLEQVVIAGDRPEARAVRFVPPGDRILAAEPGERGVGHPGDVGVVARDVGVRVAEIQAPHVPRL